MQLGANDAYRERRHDRYKRVQEVVVKLTVEWRILVSVSAPTACAFLRSSCCLRTSSSRIYFKVGVKLGEK